MVFKTACLQWVSWHILLPSRVPVSTLSSQMEAEQPLLFLPPGEPLYAQREHAHGEPGPARGHGVSVVPLHSVHDG